jgi:hypothetical protein
MQLTPVDLKARVERLRGLETGFAREIALQRDDELLLFRERKQYLTAIHEALAGAEAARVVLAGVVKRMERDCKTQLTGRRSPDVRVAPQSTPANGGPARTPWKEKNLPPSAVRLLTAEAL